MAGKSSGSHVRAVTQSGRAAGLAELGAAGAASAASSASLPAPGMVRFHLGGSHLR